MHFFERHFANLQNPSWYRNELSLPVHTVCVTHDKDAGGHHGEILRVVAVLDNQSELNLIAKVLRQADPSQQFDREIFVYRDFLPRLAQQGQHTLFHSPKLYFSDYDATIGAKILLLDNIPSLHCGLFFGDSLPHNQNPSEQSKIQQIPTLFPNISAIDLTTNAFQQIARFHGAFWLIQPDSIPSYINGSCWAREIQAGSAQLLDSPGRQQYDAFMSLAVTNWAQLEVKRPSIKIPPQLIEVIDYALQHSTYERFIQRLASRPYTVIHSDFYPANCLLEKPHQGSNLEVGEKDHVGPDGLPRLFIIDYELTSIGCGPQDLAQWVISHLDPILREQHEEKLLECYYTALKHAWKAQFGEEQMDIYAAQYTLDDVKTDYIYGAGKWLWLLAVCVPFCDGISDSMYQHFVSQLSAFCTHFNIRPDGNIPLARP